jgi:biopolymer transport protein ExbD
MRIRIRHPVTLARFSATAILDCVAICVLLLIVIDEIMFWMDPWEEVLLPDVVASVPDEPPHDPNRLVIHILRSGTIIIGGEVRGDRAVHDVLVTEAHLSRRPDGYSDREVLIKADERVEFRHVQKIIDWCRAEDIRLWRIAFATLPFDEGREGPCSPAHDTQ